jgi:hypothetical protein
MPLGKGQKLRFYIVSYKMSVLQQLFISPVFSPVYLACQALRKYLNNKGNNLIYVRYLEELTMD